MAGGGGYQQSQVELSLSCTKLLDLDRFSKSDPACFLYRAVTKRNVKEWELVGRTEVIRDNLNPKFSKTFLVDYHFEEVQRYRASVYDIDNEREVDNVKKHDFIGEAEFTVADIVTSGKVLSRQLTSPTNRNCGWIHINGEEVQDSKYDVSMQLYATKLDKKDFFGKSDPFFEIAKSQEGGAFTVAYRSQAVMKTLDPRWPTFVLPIRTLCSGDWDRTLHISVFDWNKSGDHELIGKATCTLRDLTQASGKVTQLELIHAEIKAKKGRKYHNSGVLHFANVSTIPTYSFIDYIKGGCDINLVVAVDFTGSNGKPTNPNSLHYNDPNKDNEYVSAIKSVATILADYDTDQLFPAFGFGARAPQFGGVSHCFPLNFNFEQPEVHGVQGILDAYRYTLGVVELYGPTNFSSILDKVTSFASGGASQTDQQYYILLIITDGIITDMERTVDRIVKASSLPLSVVIVGVGKADFAAMDALDADDKPLVDSSGRKMTRDIVQFVPLRKFSTVGASFSLARETLAEIPGQFMAFMKHKGIKPNPPVVKPAPPAQTGPYPGQQGTAPYPGQQGTAPYPGQQGTAPYPGQQGSAPYPTGQQGSAPYPTGQQGSAPYPTGQGTTPYPTGKQGTAPYPTAPSGGPPYPSAPPLSTSTTKR